MKRQTESYWIRCTSEFKMLLIIIEIKVHLKPKFVITYDGKDNGGHGNSFNMPETIVSEAIIERKQPLVCVKVWNFETGFWDSITGAFLWILWILSEQLLGRTHMVGWFCRVQRLFGLENVIGFSWFSLIVRSVLANSAQWILSTAALPKASWISGKSICKHVKNLYWLL